MKINDRVLTPHGVGTVKKIEPYDTRRCGILHDVYPKTHPKDMYTDNILYYFPKELTKDNLPIPNTPDTHNTQDNIDSNKYSD